MGSLAIRVTARSAKPGIGEWNSDSAGRAYLDIRVAAAPVGGAANEEVIRLLARALGIAKGEVRIVSGHGARLKRLEVPLDEAQIRQRL